jgi:murein DD-endopeptidase MepM/ murein hydrolase activator NlpD
MGRMLRRALLSVTALATVAGLLVGCGSGGPVRDAGGGNGRAPGPGASRSPSESPGQSPGRSPGASPIRSLSPPPSGARYVFPVDGRASYAREHHDYPASDILAPCGAVVRAVTDGVVLEVSRVDTFDRSTSDGGERGGLSVSVLGDDGVRYYGSHFSAIDDPVRPGARVVAGSRLGLVGRTGNANNTCHLHLGLSPVCARTGDWWVRRGVVWPWAFLDAWRRGEPASPAAEVRSWHAKHGCPASP